MPVGIEVMGERLGPVLERMGRGVGGYELCAVPGAVPGRVVPIDRLAVVLAFVAEQSAEPIEIVRLPFLVPIRRVRAGMTSRCLPRNDPTVVPSCGQLLWMAALNASIACT